MNRDHGHPAAPSTTASERRTTQAPPTITPLEIEQVIERVSTRYIAELQALKEQLRQPLPDGTHESLATHPSELEQRDRVPTETETARMDFSPAELSVSLGATGPTSQATPVQQDQPAQVPASYVRPQAQPPHLTWGERLRQKEWNLNSLYWAVIWVVAMLIGLGIGALIATMTAAG